MPTVTLTTALVDYHERGKALPKYGGREVKSMADIVLEVHTNALDTLLHVIASAKDDTEIALLKVRYAKTEENRIFWEKKVEFLRYRTKIREADIPAATARAVNMRRQHDAERAAIAAWRADGEPRLKPK